LDKLAEELAAPPQNTPQKNKRGPC